MTKLSMEVLDLLKEDCRLSAKKIASMLNASEKDVVAVIDEMEKSGIIVKYTALVDDEKLNSGAVEALIEVKVSPSSKSGFDNIASEIMAHEEVQSLYLMSGAYDLCIIIEGATLRDVASFVSEKLSVITGVLSTATHFILKKYKMSGVDTLSGEIKRQLVHA